MTRGRLTVRERWWRGELPARRPSGVTPRQWAALTARLGERMPYRLLGPHLGISAPGACDLVHRAISALERETA